MLQKNGGIIMVCFLPELVKSCNEEVATILHVVDHIVYKGQRIGYAHVSIGSDFDGMFNDPDGLDEVSQYPSLISMLLSRGVLEEDIKKVAGLNVLRVLGTVSDVAMRLRYDESRRLSVITLLVPGARRRGKWYWKKGKVDKSANSDSTRTCARCGLADTLLIIIAPQHDDASFSTFSCNLFIFTFLCAAAD